MRRHQPTEMTPVTEPRSAQELEEFFDWAGYESWLADPSQDAFLWMLEEDE